MKLTLLPTGTFKLDGGAMFGIVPKRMWNKVNPADENNLCIWAVRCLLIEISDCSPFGGGLFRFWHCGLIESRNQKTWSHLQCFFWVLS
ncbi:MAG: hypothetical protein K9J37_00355 [Saprospiraceae bacterium]|nr:hypothetical protein [Saprospiraceae bacterium]MCF8248324.1 hypothetical protein [Saprospiraceae bacterium]MCF8280237.1 hypothetical protein [Bacteroidales bacterium]MCF8309852.1 hypothetical protein [Saprospiraceae bacterium]MCF8438817.1 hypothetical protein [Saprospiraceae bacterium]